MAETPPRVPPQRRGEGPKQSAGDAPVLGAAKAKKVKLDGDAFGARFNGPLVHESVRAELNARRRGTAATKTRGEVRGGGAKPWRQKGTGRARAGSSRSPIWTGGGVVFGPQPRRYTFKVNRKERRAALRSALSAHAERGTIAVLDPTPFDEPSTKQAHALIESWPTRPGGGSVLVVLSEDQGQVALSFRNLRRVSVRPSSQVGVADLVGAVSLLLTEEALDELTRRAKGEKEEAE
jgi:large subunit ribosomal protein L4